MDSNVIGALSASSALRAEFRHLKEEGVAFHLNEYVLDEIFEAIAYQSLDRREVGDLLASLLDADVPVLPYQHFLYGLCGFGGTPERDCVSRVDAIKHAFLGWRELLSGTAPIEAMLVTITEKERERLATQRHEYAKSLARAEGSARKGDEKDIPAVLEQAVSEYARRFDDRYPVEQGPLASVRCDAAVRSHALLALRQHFEGKPANLESKAQRGTMYDQCMLSALAIPAYLVTGDVPLRKRVHASGSYQSHWMMDAYELRDRHNRGELSALSFPE